MVSAIDVLLSTTSKAQPVRRNVWELNILFSKNPNFGEASSVETRRLRVIGITPGFKRSRNDRFVALS